MQEPFLTYPADSAPRTTGADIVAIKDVVNTQLSVIAYTNHTLVEASIDILAKSNQIGQSIYYITIGSKDLTLDNVRYIANATSWTTLFFLTDISRDEFDVKQTGDDEFVITWEVFNTTY